MSRIYQGYATDPDNADLDTLSAQVRAAAIAAAGGEVTSAVLLNADVGLTAGVDKPNQLAVTVLTAARNITLANALAANEGAYFTISRSSAGAFDYSVKRADGTLLAAISQNDWCTVMVDENGVWQLIAAGTLT
jgi:hypothetical protein